MTRETKRQEQRDRILRAARSLFSLNGAEAVSMDEIADYAGVSRGTVFNYFGSKSGLIEAITEEVLGRYGDLLGDALQHRDASVPSLVRRLFRLFGVGIEADQQLYREVFREITETAVGLRQGPGRLARQQARELMEQLLTRGQARREITTDLDASDLASAADSLIFGTITHWLYDDACEPLETRMARVADVFFSGVEVLPDTRKPR